MITHALDHCSLAEHSTAALVVTIGMIQIGSRRGARPQGKALRALGALVRAILRALSGLNRRVTGHRRWLWLPALCSAVLAGCAGVPQPAEPEDLPELSISGLVIENRTTAYVSAARLLVPVTGQFVSCGNIAPRTQCATAFPEQRYSGNAFEVTWSQGGNIWSTGELRIEPDAELVEAGEAWVRVVIAGPGSAGAEFMRAR